MWRYFDFLLIRDTLLIRYSPSLEKELQKYVGKNENLNGDLESVLALLMDVKDSHQHALYSAGIDPSSVTDMESLLEEIRKASAESLPDIDNPYDSGAINMNKFNGGDEEDVESKLIEYVPIPPDDGVENLLARIVGLDVVKNHVRGLRRTLEIEQQVLRSEKAVKKYRNATNCNKGVRKIRHLALVGNP